MRRRNCGIDGRPVLFMLGALTTITATKKPSRERRSPRLPPDLIDGLRSLGMVTVTPLDVECDGGADTRTLGTDGVAQGEVLRAVFLHLRAQGSGR